MLDETAEIHSQMLIGGDWVDSGNGETIVVEHLLRQVEAVHGHEHRVRHG